MFGSVSVVSAPVMVELAGVVTHVMHMCSRFGNRGVTPLKNILPCHDQAECLVKVMGLTLCSINMYVHAYKCIYIYFARLM